LNSEVASAVGLDATDAEALGSFLTGVDSFVSAVPYWLNPGITAVAIRARACMCDLGGNTDLVLEQLKLDEAAAEADIAIVPDCGQVPGMGTSLSVYAMSMLDRTDHLFMWDGGNDQHPRPPFTYISTFHVAGLTNEYYGEAIFLRDGKVVRVPTFLREDYEEVEFPAPIGTMEAFIAGGGTSTAPWTFEGKVQTFQNKTLRWKGHFEQWKFIIDTGLMDLKPVLVNGQPVVPRDVLHACVGPKITAGPDDRDFVIITIRARGPDLKGHRQSAIVGLANDAVIIVEVTGSNVHPEGGPDLRIWYTAFEIWISWTATPVRSATVIWESVVRRSAGSAMTLPSSRTSPSCNTPALSA